MSNLSFFVAKGNGSGICRGYQIAKRISNAKVYLKEEFDKDKFKNNVCIWVKCLPDENFPSRSFFDVVDNRSSLKWIKNHPGMGVIASSDNSFLAIRKYLNREDVKLIPHHHCNFENYKRKIGPVTSVGYIGASRPYRQFIQPIVEGLSKGGLVFKYRLKPESRIDVVNFFKSIDIQISYRPRKQRLRNSLKLSNSGSFAIPTVAYPEIAYKKEYSGCFAEVTSPNDIISACNKLRDDMVFYNEIAQKSFDKAKEYHINKIIPLYRELIC